MRFTLARLLVWVPALAAAQVPVGDQFQVNTYTTDSQDGVAIAADSAGGFIVTWTSDGSNGTDSHGDSVQAQRYRGDGTPVGREFQVNTYTLYYQAYPAISGDGAGGFVVVWQSHGSSGTDTSAASIQGQRFAADGTPSGDQFQVNTYTTGTQNRAAVSPDGGGGFVVVWQSHGAHDDTDGRSIQARRYDADGSPVGDQFQVNTYTTSYQSRPTVAFDGAGGFVVAWGSQGSSGTDSSATSVQVRRYLADGTALGPEFQINTYTTGHQSYPSVEADGTAGFVVVWQSQGSAGNDPSQSIQARHYPRDFVPPVPEVQVNTYTTGVQSSPAVSDDGAGGFVVTWTSNGSAGTDSDSRSIQAQRFAPGSTPIGGELQVNTYTFDAQFSPVVSPVGGGGFVVAWVSEDFGGADNSERSVQAQRYELIEIFADGFESGDTSAWSTTVP